MACMLDIFCRQFEQLWLAGTLAKLVKCDGGFAWVDVQIGLGYQDKVNNLNVTTKLVLCLIFTYFDFSYPYVKLTHLSQQNYVNKIKLINLS